MKKFSFWVVLMLALGACGGSKPAAPVLVGAEKIPAKHGLLAPTAVGAPMGPGSGAPHGSHGGMTRSKLAGLDKGAIVLKVDAQSFTKGDFDRTLAQAAALSGVPPHMLEGEMKEAFEQPAYEKMIERSLLVKEARQRKLWPTDDEAKAATAEMVKQLPRDKKLADVLTQLGTDEAAFAADVRIDVAISRLLKDVEAAVPAAAAAVIDKIYQDNKAVFVVPDTASASQILIKVERSATPQVLGEKKKQAESIKALVAGKDAATFARVAQEQSEDTVTRGNGGDLGTFKHGDVFAEIESLAFSLKAGQTGGPVQTERGFHVVRGGGVTRGRSLPAAEAKAIISDREKVKAFMAAIDELTASLRKAAIIERVVEPLASPLVDSKESGSKVPSWKANGRNVAPGMASPHGGNGGADAAAHP